MLEFTCLTCGRRVHATDSFARQHVHCPVCNAAATALQAGDATFREGETPQLVASHPPAWWNILSVATPFVGCIAGGLVGLVYLFGDVMNRLHTAPDWGLGVWLAFCAFGILATMIALWRQERSWAVTALGFVLNGCVLIWICCVNRWIELG